MLLVISLSSLVQFAAAVMAIRLISASGAFSAWLLLAAGFAIQGVRRALTLFEVVNGSLQGDLIVETLGLAMKKGVSKKLLFSCAGDGEKTLGDVSQRDRHSVLHLVIEGWAIHENV